MLLQRERWLTVFIVKICNGWLCKYVIKMLLRWVIETGHPKSWFQWDVLHFWVWTSDLLNIQGQGFVKFTLHMKRSITWGCFLNACSKSVLETVGGLRACMSNINSKWRCCCPYWSRDQTFQWHSPCWISGVYSAVDPPNKGPGAYTPGLGRVDSIWTSGEQCQGYTGT